MARESVSMVGSGIQALRHTHNLTRIGGTNNVVINPEDIASALGIFDVARIDVDATTATNLTSGVLAARRKVLIRNQGPATVFVGDSAVTAGTGYPVDSGAALELDVLGFGSPHAITSAGTADIRVLQLA